MTIKSDLIALVKNTVKNFREFPWVVFEKSRFNILLNFHILYACFYVMKYLKLGTWFLQKLRIEIPSNLQSTFKS